MKNPLKSDNDKNHIKALKQEKDRLLKEHELWLEVKIGQQHKIQVFGDDSYAAIIENERTLALRTCCLPD